MAFRIGSFNMRNIGLAALSDDNSRDIEKIARIIRNEEFDVVALQEVLSEGKAIFSEKYAEKTILWELGSDWDFRWADAETSGADKRHEGYAFVWNKKRLRLSSAILDDGTERIFNPRICRVKYGNMIRKPYYARFTPKGTFASIPIEIRLLCIHTFFGQNDNLADRLVRQRELDTLLKEIYPQIADRVYKDDLPSYTIVLGDYNAELYRPWHDLLERPKKAMYIDDVVIAHNWDDMAIKTVQDQLTTLKGSSSQEDDEYSPSDESKANRLAHNYDHFSYEDSERFDELSIKCKRIDAIRKYTDDDADKYRREISDHLPIMLSIEIG